MCNPKVYFHIHERPPPVLALNQMNPYHVISYNLLTAFLILSCDLRVFSKRLLSHNFFEPNESIPRHVVQFIYGIFNIILRSARVF